ncbi:hydrogenase-4 subunit G [Escherichia coli]|nr:hydrogenase-4 subunit G [Escherichia coli]
MTMAELLIGSRKTYGLNLIGGVRRDILKEQRLQTLKLVREMRADVSELVEMLACYAEYGTTHSGHWHSRPTNRP